MQEVSSVTTCGVEAVVLCQYHAVTKLTFCIGAPSHSSARRAAPARAVTDKKAPLACVPNAQYKKYTSTRGLLLVLQI
jgi:hypothetical protein